MKKVLLGIVILFSMLVSTSVVASASYYNYSGYNSDGTLNGNEYGKEATHSVITTKPVKVYRVRTGNCEANNHFHYYKTLKVGTKLKRSSYLMSTGGGCIVKNSSMKSSAHIFYFAPGTKWYK